LEAEVQNEQLREQIEVNKQLKEEILRLKKIIQDCEFEKNELRLEAEELRNQLKQRKSLFDKICRDKNNLNKEHRKLKAEYLKLKEQANLITMEEMESELEKNHRMDIETLEKVILLNISHFLF